MASCQINTLQDLTACLATEIKAEGGNQLTLSSALFPEAGDIVGYLLDANLVISGAAMPAASGSVVVTGTATILNVATQVTLTGWVDVVEGAPVVTLQLSAAPQGTAWNFNSSLSMLPSYTGANGLILQELPSFFYSLSMATPLFVIASGTSASHGTTQGLNFTGTLDITQAPLTVLASLTTATTLPLSGSIQLNAQNQPRLDLTAQIPGLSISLGKVSVTSVYAELQTAVDSASGVYQSQISLAGSVQIGSTAQAVTIRTPLLQGDFIWALEADFAPGQFSLTNGLNELTAFINGSLSDLQAPDAILAFTDFSLTQAGIGIDPKTKNIKYLSVTVSSNTPWSTPIPKMKIINVQTGWIFVNPLDSAQRSVSGYVTGTLQIGDTDPVDLQISAALPDFQIEAQLVKGTISVRDTLTYLFGSAGNVPDLVIDQMLLSLDPKGQVYSFYADIQDQDSWPLDLGITTFQLQSLGVTITYAPTGLSGSISAIFWIGQTQFLISAEHPGADEGWIFTGMLMPIPNNTIKITDALARFWGSNVALPSAVPDIEITALSAKIGTKDSSFALSGEITFDPNDPKGYQLDFADDFKVGIESFDFALQSAVSAQTGQRENSGSLACHFTVNDIAMSVEFDFKPGNDALILKMGQITATLTFGPSIDTVLTVSMGDMSFGDILTWLVNLARPGSHFSLDAPWDILNSWSLSGLELTINITQRTVGVQYAVKKDFGFIDIELIGLAYVKKNGQGTVEISFVGSFLGQKYGQADPLKWDALNDPAPSVPGKGSSLFDLKYLGFGQHIAFADPGSLSSVSDVINKLIATVIPPADLSKNPLSQLQGLTFDSGSNWLIGTQFVLMDTLAMSIIFNDPVIYGLLITLSGEQAKIFAGLSFEILYKKINDNLGMYHIVLTVPEIMRHLEFGAVSVTLPRIIIDIYTNGNFRLDFGFPANGDFSNSFAIQAFIGPVPVLGAGGFYFAWLNGATSTRVPQITNGTFDPVIEFGLGLQLGLGKTIDEGILKAGVSVVVQGILQGAFGFFHPTDPSTPSAHYYWVQGSIAIVGKLYATIDFAIIKASLDVTISVGVQLTVEAYEPIVIYMYASVSVTLSVKIVFFTIHLSFKATVSATFTIGSKTTPPWMVGSSQNAQALRAAPRPKLGLTRPDALRTRPIRPAGFQGITANWLVEAHRYLAAGAGTDWSAFPVWTSVQTVPLTLAPNFTAGLPVGDPYTNETSRLVRAAAAGSPVPMGIATLFVQNSIPSDALGASDYGPLDDNTPAWPSSPFDMVIQAMLAWTIHAYAPATQQESPTATSATPYSPVVQGMTVSLLHLQDIYQQLSAQIDAGQSPFTMTRLADFFVPNLTFGITGRSTDINTPTTSVTIFPMPPVLSLQTSDMTDPIDFSSYKPCGQTYQHYVNVYLQQMMVAFENARNQGTQEMRDVPDTKLESLAGFIFQDYFALTAKAAVQSAIDYLTQYAYPIATNDSLTSIATRFSQYGDGVVLTAGDILQANQSTQNLFAAKASLTLSGVRYSVLKGDTLQSIANAFTGGVLTDLITLNADQEGLLQKDAAFPLTGIQYTVPAQSSMAGLATAFQIPIGNVILGNSTGNEPTLLPDGTSVSLLNTRYTVVSGDTFDSIAQQFQTTSTLILALNPTLSANQTLTAGMALLIPIVKYTTVGGDTLGGLCYRFSTTASAIETLNTNVDFSSLPAGTVLNMPDLRLIVPPSTDIGVTRLFDIALQDLATANTGIDFNKVLPGNTALNIANTRYSTIPGDTPASIAQQFDTTTALIAALNPNVDFNAALVPGTLLVIPTITYTTIGGDTESILIARFQITAKLLEALNPQINFQNPLTPGTVLNMPDLIYTVPTTAGAASPVKDRDIAAYFHIPLQSLILANPLVDFSQVLAAGIVLAIPPVAYVVGAADTLNSIGYRFGLPTQALAGQVAGLAVLQLVATLLLPDFAYAVQATDTFGSIASAHNLTITDLALVEANQTDTTLLAVGQTLTLPNVPGLDAPSLLDGIYISGKTQNIAGMVSRFLLSGLRLPDPADPALQKPIDQVDWATLNTYPLYALTGQQFSISSPTTTSYAIDLELTTATSWVTLPSQATPSTLTLNLLQEEVDFINAVATTPFTPNIVSVAKTPLYSETPLQSTLQHSMLWQCAVAPSLWIGPDASLPASGQPTIRPFPAGLLLAVTNAESYGLRMAPQIGVYNQPGVSTLSVTPVTAYNWATVIDLYLGPIPGSEGSGPLPNTYAVQGTDDAGRSLLQQLWVALSTGTPAVTPSLALLYPPNAAGANPTGLISDEVDSAQILLLKTNLSTLSHSAQERLLMAESGVTTPDTVFSAALSDAADFVKLLWECSVVNSGGYYLQYATQTGGEGLPSSLFAATGSATLQLLIMYEAIDAANSTVYPFQNSVVIGDNISTNSLLFTEAVFYTVVGDETLITIATPYGLNAGQLAQANSTREDLLRVGASMQVGGNAYLVAPYDTFAGISAAKGVPVAQLGNDNASAPGLLQVGTLMDMNAGMVVKTASSPPGNVGFQLIRTDPTVGVDPNSEPVNVKLEVLYNLLGYEIVPTTPTNYFNQSPEGVPIGPATSLPAMPNSRVATAPPASGTWNYERVLPVYPYATTNDITGTGNVPPASGTPYAGIVSGAEVQVQLDFNDIFGNQIPASPAVDDLLIGVGYYDNIIGISQWPAVTASYLFTAGSSASANFDVFLHFDVSRYMPDPGTTVSACLAKAQADLAVYTQIYYQIQQTDLDFTVRTTVNQLAVATLDKSTVTGLVDAIYAYLATVQTLQEVVYPVQATDTLASVVKAYSVAPGDLVALNDAISGLFAAPLSVAVPLYHSIAFGDSLDSIAAQSGIALATLVQNSAAVPNLLSTGVAVAIGTAAYTASATDTLSGILAQFTSSKATTPTVAGLGDLAIANQAVTLADNVTFTYQGNAYTTQGSDTFTTVLTHFPGGNLPGLAGENAQIPLFAANTPLTIPLLYTVKSGDTLAGIAALYSATALQIAENNADSTTLLQQGAGLFLSTQPMAIQADDSLQTIAAAAGRTTHYSLTSTDIALQNLSHPLNPGMVGGALTIPDLVTLNPNLPATYQVTGNDTLAGIAASRGLLVIDLAQGNKDLFGMLASGITITAAGVSYVTSANDTLNTVLANLNAQLAVADRIALADLALAVKERAGLLAANAWILLPPPMTTLSTPIALSAQTYPPQTVFAVTAQLDMARASALIDKDFRDVPGVLCATTVLNPSTYDPNAPNAALTLTGIATDFEAAFAGLHLATAHAPSQVSEDSSSSAPPSLWAINLSSTGTQIDIAGATPYFFAVPPLSNTLLGEANVSLQAYQSGVGLVPANPKSFQSIDLDVWARDFLGAIDSFLLPENVAPAFQLPLGDNQSGLTGAQAYETVLTAKQLLAEAIQTGVTNILVPSGQIPTANVTAAQNSLGQQLLIALGSAYTVDAIVQFDVNVTSHYADANAAAFSGQPQAASVDPVVDYTLSSAQVPLSNGTSYLTFLFSTKSPASDKAVILTGLTYQINELEFGITPVPGIDGYVASSWLSFINPLTATPVAGNPTVVPVPLRAYPMPPTLVSQETVYVPDTQVADIETWEYDFTYDALLANQDTVSTGIQFNIPPSLAGLRARGAQPDNAVTPTNLFEALAQFSFAYPAIAADLALLPLVATHPNLASQALTAVQAFASLVAAVPPFWSYPAPSQEEIYDYRYTLHEAVDAEDTLHVTVRPIGGKSPTAAPMPQLTRRGYRLVEVQSIEGADKAESGISEWTHRFTRLSDLAEAGTPPSPTAQTTVKFPNNNILASQTAQGSVWIVRNSNLIAGAETEATFVYQTPAVSFTNPLLPLLINNDAFDISEINADGTMSKNPQQRTLIQHLTALFSALFLKAPSPPVIKVLCRYSYDLITSSGQVPSALSISIPVFLVAQYALQQSDLTPPSGSCSNPPPGFLWELTCAIQSWQAANQPVGGGGAYLFEIDVFSSIAPQATQPILQITKLQLALPDILPSG